MQFRLIATIVIVAALAACTSDTGEEPTLQVQDSNGEWQAVGSGEEVSVEQEDRSAIVAIFKGSLAPEERPYSAELVRSIDLPVFRDIDAADVGSDLWITRAQVLDADGNVLWQDRVNSMFQLIEYLSVILDGSVAIPLNLQGVFDFVDRDYPGLLEFPVRVPTGITGGVTFRMMVPDADGELYEAYRAPIDEIVAAAKPPEYEGEVFDVYTSGAPEDSIDFVILSDGYIDSGKHEFELDAQAVADRLLTTPPFDAYADMINVRAVWTPSNQRGAGYDCTGVLARDRFCLNDFKDTVFGTVFVISAIADQFGFDLGDTSDRVAMPLELARLYDVAAAAQYDEVLLISNTNRRSGFAGIYASVVTAFDTRVDFPDVAVHEFGHSFALLGDEYQVSGDPCLYNAPRVPLPVNIAEEVTYEQLKWASWVDGETPLPTPEDQSRFHPVGAYEGAYNCDFLYRPARDCKMLSSSDEFCPVCTEQVSRRFYNFVDPVAHGRDGGATVRGNDDGTLTFAVVPKGPASAVWTLDGEVIGEELSLTLTPGEAGDESTLEVTVEETTGLIRDRTAREQSTISWTVRTR